MTIYSTLQIGEYHLNHCEDYLFVGQIGDHKTLCAVMDGCTMGTDSYLASTLVGKLLRKIAKEKSYKELYGLESYADLDQYLLAILAALFKELNLAKNQLALEKNELLTTLLLLLVDKQQNTGIVLVIGDGVVCVNGQVTTFDQDNKPDYLGFHLNEDVDTWYANQQQKIIVNTISDISIATDGIETFTAIKKMDATESIDPIGLLLSDKTGTDNEDMLNLKLKRLEHVFGLKPTDDLAIIRLIN
jgi:hypothetical protein